MTSQVPSVRLLGECAALMTGLAGAALSFAIGLPAAINIEHHPSARAAEVGPIVFDHAEAVSCARGYSTALSSIEVFDRPEDVLTPRQLSASFVDLETAVCFAEEHYLGEGQARMVHFEIDERSNVPIWAIMGAAGEVVAVAAGAAFVGP